MHTKEANTYKLDKFPPKCSPISEVEKVYSAEPLKGELQAYVKDTQECSSVFIYT